MEKYIPVGKLVAMQVFVEKCNDDPNFLSEHQFLYNMACRTLGTWRDRIAKAFAENAHEQLEQQSLFVLERTDYLG